MYTGLTFLFCLLVKEYPRNALLIVTLTNEKHMQIENLVFLPTASSTFS